MISFTFLLCKTYDGAQATTSPLCMTSTETFPGFYYYGRKKQLSKRYPPPDHARIIEPFAGSAAYSCTHPSMQVILIDMDIQIVETWRFLIGASRRDILRLPILLKNETLDDNKFKRLSIGAKCFIGFNLGVAAHPLKRPSRYCHWTAQYRQLVADRIHLINHWRVIHGDYTKVRNLIATWFIDPPYSGKAGDEYKHGSSEIDYRALKTWIKSRKGTTITCENASAKWMKFKPLVQHYSSTHKPRIEGV